MIEKVEISNFKNIAQIALPLERINVLIGANNSGKSSILQAIQFAVSVAQTTNFESSRWNRHSHRLPTSLTPDQLMYAPLRDVYSLARGGKLKTDIRAAISVEFFEKDTNNTTKVIIRKGKNKNIATEIHNEPIGNQLRNIETPFSIYVPGLAGIPTYEEWKSPGIIRRAAARGDANNVFRNILWLLHSQTENWTTFCEDVRYIFPSVQIEVDFNEERDEFLNIRIRKGDVVLPIDAAGTGFLQVIQILSYINVYKPKLLLLDEPDAHLHPDNQRKLARKLEMIAEERDFQILISTHSRHFYDEIEEIAQINWIVGGALCDEDKNIVSILMSLGALDKVDRMNNTGVKLIVLSEDSDTTMLETLIKASEIPVQEIETWSYQGCADIKTANVLASYIKRHYPDVKIVLHRDRDYNEQNELDTIVAKYSQEIDYKFITDGTDIESHFLNAQHINYLHPEIDLDRAEELIRTARDNVKEESKRIYINVLCDKSMKEGRSHNGGENAQLAETNLNRDLIRYSHGKKVLGNLKSLLQQELRHNIDISSPSDFIAPNVFKEIKQELWP